MNSLTKTSIVYVSLAAFSVLFNYIYGLFSHGVRSESMSSIWIYLVLASIFFFVLNFIHSVSKKSGAFRFFFNTFNSGMALFCLGLLLSGIFEIAGTDSPYLKYYNWFGIGAIATSGTVLFLITLLGLRKRHSCLKKA